MSDLTLDKAMEIIIHARQHRRTLKAKPVAYAVVDSGGNTMAVAREEKAGFLRAQFALNKAWGCLAMGFPSRTLRDQVKGWEMWFAGCQGAAGGRLMPVLGGVVIRSRAGRILGAVGVAGAPGEVDQALGVYGIEKAGFKAEIGGEPPVDGSGRKRRG